MNAHFLTFQGSARMQTIALPCMKIHALHEHIRSRLAIVILVVAFLGGREEVDFLGGAIAIVALPELELLLDVVRDHAFLGGPLEAEEVDLVPLAELLLDAEVAEHVAAEEGEVVGDGDAALEDLAHLGLCDLADDQLLEVVVLVLEPHQQAHDVVDELVVLVAAGAPRHLHVDLEVRLHDDRALQQARLALAVGEGEVPEVLAHGEVRGPHALHQPDALQLADDLLLLLAHLVPPAGRHQREAEHVAQDLVVPRAPLEGEEALDQDRDLVAQRQPQEVEVLLAEMRAQPVDAALAQDVVALVVQQSEQVEEVAVRGLVRRQLLALQQEGVLDVVVELVLEGSVQRVERVLEARPRHDLQLLEVGHRRVEPVRPLAPRPLLVHRRQHLPLLQRPPVRRHPQDQLLRQLVERTEQAPRHHRDLDQLRNYRLAVPVHLPDYLPDHYILCLFPIAQHPSGRKIAELFQLIAGQ